MNAIADGHPATRSSPCCGTTSSSRDPGSSRPVGRVPGRVRQRRPARRRRRQLRRRCPTASLDSLNDFTISAWVNPAQVNTWSRVFDFGTGTHGEHVPDRAAPAPAPRFAITTGGGGRPSSVINRHRGQLPANQWTHFAVTLSGHDRHACTSTARQVGMNANMTLRPSSLGNTTQQLDRPLPVRRPEPQRHRSTTSRCTTARLTAEEITALPDPRRAPATSSPTSSTRRAAPTAVDSSGNGRDATDGRPDSSTAEGKVFKQRDVARDVLVPWKDQQNFSPFTEGVVPNTDKYRVALRFFADTRRVPDHAVLHRQPARQGGGGGGRQGRQQQLLEHQLDAPGAALRQGAARVPVRLHHAGHVPASCSSG